MTLDHATRYSQISYPEYADDAYRSLLDRNGYVYLDRVPGDFDHLGFLKRLGPPLPQYDGELVWSIKADPRYDGMYHSLNTKELTPHTECTEFETTPPRYLALWCLVPPADGKGQTILADMYSFLETLTPAERVMLGSRRYEFAATAGLQSMRFGRSAVHPILEDRGAARPLMRFSYSCIVHDDDPFVLDIRARVLDFVDRTHVAIEYSPGALLVWDNHRVVHSRTAYQDRRRHLRRVWLGET
jgi:alpha-ketoglutarate-dependent taurine dioxygenase